MSVRYEWISATYCRVEWVPDGYDVRTGAPPDDDSDPDQITTYGGALLLAGDEVTVLAGTPDEVRAVLQRALDALPGRRGD